MSAIVVFHLKRIWEGKDLWEEIRTGRKTSEWRDATPYWFRRLLRSGGLIINTEEVLDLSKSLKVRRAWFIVGYPKANLPRLEAEITAIFLHGETQQFEVKFSSIKEVGT